MQLEPPSSPSRVQAARTSPRRRFIALVVVQVSVTIAWMAVMSTEPHRWRQLLMGLAYAGVIGTLAYALLPKVSSRSASLTPWQRWPIVLAASAAVGAAGSLLTTLLLGAMHVFAWSGVQRSAVGNAVSSAILAALIGGAWTFYETHSYRRRLAQSEAQLASLQARIQPHFLFNTLNSIAALVTENPAAAECMIEKLSALLRHSLHTDRQATIALRDELRIVTDYLDIERMRHGESLYCSIDVPAEFLACSVPPFSLQTLVENGLKHGSPPFRIRAEAIHDTLNIEVIDAGPGVRTAAMPAGHGLENLRERLELVWGKASTVQFVSDANSCTVRIAVPRAC